MNKEFVTQELRMRQRRKRNKIFLGIFLSIAVIALILKLVDEIMLDLGYHDGELHLGFWKDKTFRNEAYGLDAKGTKIGEGVLSMQRQIERHPNFFFNLTQFTWLTTTVIIILTIFRFFKYDQSSLPRWLKWIMTQRTLSLVAMYDFIVAIIFWGSMFKGFSDGFSPELYGLELTITIMVHAIVPVMFITYSIIYLVKDKRASMLKEGFILKGMILPVIYIAYYVLIAVIWTDPYPMTKLQDDFVKYIYMAPLALVGMYLLLGLMILFHNLALFRHNKSYDPKNDYEINMRMNSKIEKIQRKYIRKRKYDANNKLVIKNNKRK